MTIYLDTSAIVAALVPEVATLRVQNWLQRDHAEELATSAWVDTEVVSALSQKVRTE